MKNIILMIFGISLIVPGIGCGKDNPPKDAAKAKDRIENVGDAASKLGYNGENIKENLRGLQDLKKKQDKDMNETLNQ